MRIIFDTTTKRFSIRDSVLDEKLQEISYECMHNIIRLILRPTSNSADHWKSELYAFLKKDLCKYLKSGKRHISEITSCISNSKHNLSKLKFIDYLLKDLVDKVRLESSYGVSRTLSYESIAVGIWIFLSTSRSDLKFYSPQMLIEDINNWYEKILDPDYDLDYIDIKRHIIMHP